jgi:alpha-maltose-1-phosphate synthase
MRVVHLFRGFHDYIRELVNEESEIADVHVILSERDRAIAKEFSAGVHVHQIPLPRVRSPFNILYLRRLRTLVSELNPDVLHLQSGLVWEYGVLARRRFSPVVLTVHDVVEHPSWGGWTSAPPFMSRVAVRTADAVIVHGQFNRELLLKRHKDVLPGRVYSLNHGVISRYGEGRARRNVPRGSGNILFFGRIDKYKGLKYLLNAVQRLRPQFPELSVVVAGAVKRREYCEILRKENPDISFRLGYQSRDMVENLFRWADVLALPYLEASQSGVLQIAVAFGVPVVATNVGAIPEAITDGMNGRLVPARDSESLAAAVADLLTDTETRGRIIDTLRIQRNGKFSWSSIARKTMDIYREVIDIQPVGSRVPGAEAGSWK